MIHNQQNNNIFGALKLIEQLYLDGEIPEYMFRNILREYNGVVSVTSFICDRDKPPSNNGG